MKIVVELRHPAHFHHFKLLISQLTDNGHIVKIIVSNKDILITLLDNLNYSYEVIGQNKKGIFNKIIEQLKQNIKVFRICRKFKPDILIGRPSQTSTLNSFILKINSVIFAEDDFSTVFSNAIISFPFAKFIIAPTETDLGMFRKKKISYAGYQKLAYLHPKYFKPDVRKIEDYVDLKKPIYLIRFSKLSASHDIGIGGISNDIGKEIIKKLEGRGQVFISSERDINSYFKNYQLTLPIEDIHHLMYFADLFIGDSQSMAFEAAMLGTPSIRFSDFAGKINVLEELEQKYKLTFGINTSEPEKLIEKIDELLNTLNLKKVFQIRKQKMLSDKIDVTAFMVWFVENYPDSLKIMKEAPEFQWKFK